jgi:hypothetical protein
MKRRGALRKHIVYIVLLYLVFAVIGCSVNTEEIPSVTLRSVPYECERLSNIHTRALQGAYERANVSQLQVIRATNKFSECLQNSGLSEAESRAVINNKVESVKKEMKKIDEHSGQDIFVF